MKMLLCLGCVVSLTACGFGHGEEGVHIGIITDVSRSGWFCKTWEGQVMTGHGNSAVKYEFTIEDEKIVEVLKSAQRSGKEVLLSYNSPRIYTICRSDYPNFITSAEIQHESSGEMK